MAERDYDEASQEKLTCEGDVNDQETTIKFYLEAFESYICENLSTPDLYKLILCYDGFNHDEKQRISRNDEKKTHDELFYEIMKSIRNLKDDKKYTSLLKAFRKMEHEKICLILSGTALPKNEAHKKLLYKCVVTICDMLGVADVLPDLIAKDLLSTQDRQVVEQTLQMKGNWNAAFEVIKCLSNKKVEWYKLFIEILLRTNHDDLARLIDKELREMHERGEDTCISMAINQESTQVSGVSTPGHQRVMVDVKGPSSVVEHVMSDLQEAEVDNEGAPPPLPRRFDSLTESADDSNCADSLTEPTEQEIDQESTDEASSKLELRDYQLELAENALNGDNTVIVAGTGSGKTWVALHIVKEHLDKLGQGTRKVVFMARTSALIKQQADRFKKYLQNYKTKLLTGENEDSSNLAMFLETNDILCFTPQILVNNLDNKSIKSLSEFSLMILDECHHTKGDTPYNTLMRKYLIEKNLHKGRLLPQVIGLTASIGVGKSHNVEEACDYLLHVLASLDVRVLSTVRKCKDHYEKITTNPTEDLIPMVIPKKDPCVDILLGAVHETEDRLQDFTLLNPSMVELIVNCPPKKESQEYAKWTVEVERLALHNIVDNDMLRNVRMCAIYLNVYNAAIEVNSLLGPSDVIMFLATKHQLDYDSQERLTAEEKELLKNLKDVQKKLSKHVRNENPNVRKLSDILKDMMSKDVDNSRAMVFVKARATCVALARFLKKDLADTEIAVHELYGKENRGGIDGMTESVQNDTVEKFRTGHYKVLVATSVGVEGIDVPDCNIVLNYNFQGNEITKIQMKGRSRKKDGHHVVIGSEFHLELEGINAYKLAMMQKALVHFDKMDRKVVNRKILLYQKEEMQTYKMRKMIDEDKRSRKSNVVDFEIRCRRCNTLACYTSDIRMVKCQYIVIDKSFAEKINLKPHKRPKMFDGFYKKYKMYCKKCPLDWGIVSENRGLICRTLKLECFKLRNMQNRQTQAYKKWEDVPVAINEIDIDDLTRLLGEVQVE